jgi:uncharacterized protein (TIGR00369 family)
VSAERVDGAELARQFLQHSPFGGLVGLELVQLTPDRAELRLPFKPEVATTPDVVHGGAISALIDTAATAAAWSAEFAEMPERWGTVSITVNFERPASGDLVAEARVTRRGRSLCFCEVAVEAGDKRVASGSVVYALAAQLNES